MCNLHVVIHVGDLVMVLFVCSVCVFQFFHEVDETGQWLLEDLKKLHDTFELTPLQGDKKDADNLCKELDVCI